MMHTLLIVDDEPNVIASLKRALFREKLNILTASGGSEGLDLLVRFPVHVVISDEKMPGMSGSEFLSEVKQRYPDIVRLMLTGQASIEAAMRAINEGEIYRFFTKPWDDLQLVLAIRSAFEKHDLHAENRLLLQTVRRQAVELKLLEKQFPGIGEVKRDKSGMIVLDNLSDDELQEIVRKCEEEITGSGSD
ncbi:MAG: response regulator [Nitrospiraceae bacterium]|nr:response regulator [Nitrospiraceae bacterium]